MTPRFHGMIRRGSRPAFSPHSFQALSMIQSTRLLSGCLALTLAAGFSTAATAVTTYDGTYRIDATTDEGDCARTATGTVTVSDGLIVGSSDSSVQAYGRIGEDGVVSFALHRGQDVAHISGRLKGGHGQGAWSAPAQLCGGRWQAQKLR
jgi:major membrane immunogen (membrane-anchored lipoprotein)